MDNLVATYGDQRRLDETIKLYETVLVARNMVLGKKHPDMLTNYAEPCNNVLGSEAMG